jgi:hypothetical protein
MMMIIIPVLVVLARVAMAIREINVTNVIVILIGKLHLVTIMMNPTVLVIKEKNQRKEGVVLGKLNMSQIIIVITALMIIVQVIQVENENIEISMIKIRE